MKKISIVIPVYNEEDLVVETLKKVISSDTLGLEKEIIIVDDFSKDKTIPNLEMYIKNKLKGYKNIKIIKKKKNEGKGASLKLGLLETTGDIVLIQDADLEYDPKDYPQLIRPFLEMKADVVYGSRFVTHQPRRVLYFWHYLANLFLTFLSNTLTNLNITDMETGYKVFKGDLIRNISKKLQSKKFGFEPEVTARVSKIKNIRLFEVGISYQGRTYEEGKKIRWHDGLRAVVEIVKYWIIS